MEVVSIESMSVIAVEVPPSALRPHFAGPAYVRINSESVNASQSIYDELLLSRDDKRRTLLEWRGKLCTMTVVGKQFGLYFPMGSSFTDSCEAKVSDVTAHFVRFRRAPGGQAFSEPLSQLDLTWDDQHDRPSVLVRQRP